MELTGLQMHRLMCTFVDSILQEDRAQWLSVRVLDLRPRARGFKPHWRYCVVSLSKNINPSLVLVHPRKTHPYITERLLMGRKESNQTNKKQNIARRAAHIMIAYLRSWA